MGVPRHARRSAALAAADAVWSGASGEALSLPGQLHEAIGQQAIDGGMDDRHRVTPAFRTAARRLGRDGPGDLARADGCIHGACRKQGKRAVARLGWRHERRLRPRRLRAEVIGSGLAGGCQSGGGTTRAWLVPRPMAPGC